MKKLILIAAIIAVLAFIPAKKIESLTLTADFYNVLISIGIGDRSSASIEDSDTVSKINNALSGKYIKGDLSESIPMETLCVVPYYRTDDPGRADGYSKRAVTEKRKGESVVYADTIYVLDEKTIALMDAEQVAFRTYKKIGPEIDLSLFSGEVAEE